MNVFVTREAFEKLKNKTHNPVMTWLYADDASRDELIEFVEVRKK